MTSAKKSLARLVLRCPQGFGPGYSPITRRRERVAGTGIDFGILRLPPGKAHTLSPGLETAALLLSGEVKFAVGGLEHRASRASYFDQTPVAMHVCSRDSMLVHAASDAELAVFRVENTAQFATELFDEKSMIETEDRGAGLLEGTAQRTVRTLFDRRNRPEAQLELGEVVNRPGRWSSYPPHHHPQPEIYHYRFAPTQGYGHCELGEQVVKVRNFDTVKILDNNDHPQVAAPGYRMFYIWAIRHLPHNPYTVPEFTAEHAWTLAPGAPR